MKPLRKARLHHIKIFHNQQNSPSPAAQKRCHLFGTSAAATGISVNATEIPV